MREITVYVHHAYKSSERVSFLRCVAVYEYIRNLSARHQFQFIGLSPDQFNDVLAQASAQEPFNMGYLSNLFASRTLVHHNPGCHLRRWVCLVAS